MKTKKLYLFCLFFFIIGINNNEAQERGEDWEICDAAIRRYNTLSMEVFDYATNLMLEVSGLPNPNDNPALFGYDTYQYFEPFAQPTPTDAFDAIRAAAEIEEKLMEIERLTFLAIEGIAEYYFSTIEGKDC